MSKLTGEKVIYSAKTDDEKSFEYPLYEYLPGISRIVKTGVCTNECTFVTDGGRPEIHIPLKISIIYISEYDGKIKSCTFHEQVVMPLGEDFSFEGDYIASCSCRVTGVQSKALSQRKVSVKVYLSAGVLVYAQSEIPMYSPDEDCCVFTKKVSLPVCRKKIIPDTFFENEAEITASDGKSMGEIIYTDVKSASVSARADDGEISFEADAHIHILYESAAGDDEENDGTYAFLDASVKLCDTIHSDKASAGDKPFVYIDIHSVEPSLSYDSYGENKNLSLTVKYSVSGFLYECGKKEFITDAFAENSSSEPEYTEAVIESVLSPISKKEHVSQLVHVPLGEISEIASSKAKIQVVSVEQTEGKFSALVKCRMEMLGTNPSGELYSIDTPVSFRVPVSPQDSSPANSIPEIILGISDCTSRIKDGGVEMEFDVDVNGVAVSRTPLLVVKELNANGENEKTKKSGEIIVYYPKDNEKLWDIAKKYRVSPEKLCGINRVEEKDFAKKHTVIIP